MAEETARLFIAAELTDEVKQEMIRIQDYFKKKELFEGRYPDPQAMHLTLKFLGDIPIKQIPAIQEALRIILMGPLTMSLDDIHFFGTPQLMKVLFINLFFSKLPELVRALDAVLHDFVTPEEREYVAHLTIARVKKVLNPEVLQEAIAACQVNQLQFTIDSFALKSSTLVGDGHEYADIERYSLQV